MAYVDELLGRGEQIVYTARQHIIVLISRIIAGMALIAILIAAGVMSNIAFRNNTRVLMAGLTASDLILIVMFTISMLVLLSIFGDFLRWTVEQYIVTDRRIIQIRGVLSKTIIDSSLGKINDVALRQSVLGRLFNFGSIQILTAADDGVNIMEGVIAPLAFKRAMLEAKHNYERGYGYFEPHTPSSAVNHAVVPQFDLHGTLEELARLRDRGILSTDEFEAKKRELLSRI